MSKYKTIIFDLDGVLFDSNDIKGNNIFKASSEFVDECTAIEFSNYFKGLNGVPRGQKIMNYFAENPTLAKALLSRYNSLNEESLYSASLTIGTLEYLNWCKNKYTMHVLSGGEENEINRLIKINELNHFFTKIMGGPMSKTENLRKVVIDQPVLYFGDSIVDYQTAQKFDFDFVFVYGYTQFIDWEDYFKDKGILTIENFNFLKNNITN